MKSIKPQTKGFLAGMRHLMQNTCGYCEWDEADGELILRCDNCKAELAWNKKQDRKKKRFNS